MKEKKEKDKKQPEDVQDGQPEIVTEAEGSELEKAQALAGN